MIMLFVGKQKKSSILKLFQTLQRMDLADFTDCALYKHKSLSKEQNKERSVGQINAHSLWIRDDKVGGTQESSLHIKT